MEESIDAFGSFKNPMHVAVLKGDIKSMGDLKKTRERLNGIEKGMAPLHLAVVSDDALVVKKLISLGAKLETMNEDGYTPLQLAVVLNRITLFNDLTKGYINTFNRDGNSALHMAVIKGNARAVTTLLVCGADADMRNREGHAPLHIAITLGKADVIDAVLKYARKPYIRNISKSRPLHLAVLNNQPDTIRKIGRLGNANVNYLNGFGDSPLHLAAKLGNLEAIEELHIIGANMNLKNKKGLSAIHIAVILHNLSAVETLVRCGASIDCADKDRNAPIHWAVTQNNMLVLRLLCHLAANVNIKNAFGDSPLHSAILADNRKGLRVLLNYGADLDIQNAKGMTPLHVAVCYGSKDIIEILFKVGASIYSLDANHNRPLHTAAKFCNAVGIKTIVKNLEIYLGLKNKEGLTALDIVLSYVKKNKFKTAVKSLTGLYKKFNLKRKTPLSTKEILKCAKIIVRYEILKNLENSKLNEPEYVADVIPILQKYIRESIAEVKLMKSTLLHENFPFYLFVMSGWEAKMPLTCECTSEVVLDHVLDVANTKGYPIYRDLIISRLDRSTLLKKVSHLWMYARRKEKAIFLDLDAVSLITKQLGNKDILNLLLAYSDLDLEDGVSNSSKGNKRKLAETQLDSSSVKEKPNLIGRTSGCKKIRLSVHKSAKKSRSLVNTSERASSFVNARSKKAQLFETAIVKKTHRFHKSKLVKKMAFL